jgi:hypothetical protein
MVIYRIALVDGYDPPPNKPLPPNHTGGVLSPPTAVPFSLTIPTELLISFV